VELISSLHARRVALARDLGYPFVGKLDDVRIYTRALSAAEIAKIYAGDF